MAPKLASGLRMQKGKVKPNIWIERFDSIELSQRNETPQTNAIPVKLKVPRDPAFTNIAHNDDLSSNQIEQLRRESEVRDRFRNFSNNNKLQIKLKKKRNHKGQPENDDSEQPPIKALDVESLPDPFLKIRSRITSPHEIKEQTLLQSIKPPDFKNLKGIIPREYTMFLNPRENLS